MSGFLPLHESLKQEAGSAVLSTDAQLIPNNMQLAVILLDAGQFGHGSKYLHVEK